MAMRAGRWVRLSLSGATVEAGRPSGWPAALVLSLIAMATVGAGSARADALSDCKTGTPALAIKACTSLIDAGPGRGEAALEALYYRGLAHARLGDYAKAEADLTVLIGARPRNANAFALRGDVILRRRRYDDALADLNSALGLNPSHVGVLVVRGDLYTRKRDFQAAKADLDKAIALAPRYARAYDRRGLLHRAMGNLDLALADHDAAVVLAPKEPAYLANRAQLHMQRRAYDLAVADYDGVLSLNPDYPKGRELRQRALTLKLEASRSQPPKPSPPPPPKVSSPPPPPKPLPPPPPRPPDAQAIDRLFAEANAHLKSGNVDLAIATLTRILTLAPNSARAFLERGQAYNYKNEPRNALADFTRALALDANNIQALLLRAMAFATLGDIPRAIVDCEAVMKLAPTDARGISCRGEARARGRNWTAAIDDLTKAIEGKLVNLAVAHYWRGRSYLETDNYEAAGNDADRAVALSPHWPSAVALKGSVLLAKGDIDRALAEFERALRMQRNNIDATVGHSAALIAKALQQHPVKANKE
jgi:tetratricopeptide (TPR) repeat protein